MIDIWWNPVQVHPSESKTRVWRFRFPSCDYYKVSDYCFMILLLGYRECPMGRIVIFQYLNWFFIYVLVFFVFLFFCFCFVWFFFLFLKIETLPGVLFNFWFGIPPHCWYANYSRCFGVIWICPFLVFLGQCLFSKPYVIVNFGAIWHLSTILFT